jgi:hypothetical protein
MTGSRISRGFSPMRRRAETLICRTVEDICQDCVLEAGERGSHIRLGEGVKRGLQLKESDMPLGPDGTGYTSIARADGTYEVVMVKPEGLPEVVKVFPTDAEAEHWIFEQIEQKPSELPPIITIP